MHVAVTAVGRDRPGIVAAVAKVLYEHGGNIEDSRMAILGGQFAMMLIVATDESPAALERSLGAAASAFDLTVNVRHVEDAPAGAPGGAPFILSVYGADHPGIVYRITESLATHGVNVTDLATHVVEGTPPVYVMLMEVALPPRLDAGALEATLKTLAADVGVDVSVRPAEADTL